MLQIGNRYKKMPDQVSYILKAYNRQNMRKMFPAIHAVFTDVFICLHFSKLIH